MANEKEEEPIFFYLATDDFERGGKGFLVYATDKFKLTEFDVINLIKTLVVDRRGVSIGRKIMQVYQDATGYSQKAIEKLKQIGLEMEEDEPTRTTKTKTI
jgi:hypothetical protein